MKYRNVQAASSTVEDALNKLEQDVLIVAKAGYKPIGGAIVVLVREGDHGTSYEPIWIANQSMTGC